ncbi:hypothetical protein ACJX0J_023487, partial [Zea mays]
VLLFVVGLTSNILTVLDYFISVYTADCLYSAPQQISQPNKIENISGALAFEIHLTKSDWALHMLIFINSENMFLTFLFS